jgi:hypothetical protein
MQSFKNLYEFIYPMVGSVGADFGYKREGKKKEDKEEDDKKKAPVEEEAPMNNTTSSGSSSVPPQPLGKMLRRKEQKQ